MSATGNRLKDLATKYIRLGGKRRAVLDDNLVSTREWAEDTAEAKAFWRDEIESLPDPERKDVKEPSDVERNKRPEPPWPFTWNQCERIRPSLSRAAPKSTTLQPLRGESLNY